MMSDVDQLLRDAVAHHQAGRVALAQPMYEEILRRDAGNPNALNLLGMVHHQQGRHDDAAALIERAIAVAPGVAGFHNNLGNVRLAQGRHEDAEAAYRRALALEADYVEAINNLGVALLGQGKVPEAIPLFTRAIAMRHRYPSARNNLGNALRARRQYAEAVRCYRDAIALHPDHPEAWGNLGIALLEMGEIEEAEAASRKAIALRPDAAGPHYTLGLALDEQGRRDEAMAQFRAAVAAAPGSRGLRFYIAGLTGEEQFDAAPPEFVASLFDHYADTFDRHLLGTLDYRAPHLLHAAVSATPNLDPPVDIVDLGCGTGLCGPLFKPIARTLTGVDLSARMVGQARERNVYDALHVEELAEFLKSRSDAFDLAIAADVLNYLGDLRNAFAAAAGAVRSGGAFAFTLEKHEGAEGWKLNRTHRYSHAIGYVRSILSETGWADASISEQSLRTEGKKDVAGWVVVARRARRRDVPTSSRRER